MGKFFTGVLLAVVLAALVVPVGLYLGPAVVDAIEPDAPAVEPKIPKSQRPPSEVSAMTAVTELSKTAPMPERDVLAKRLDKALIAAAEGGFTGVVVDALTGKVLYDDGGNQPRVPASNTKLLTAVTVLNALGAEHRFSTRVVQGEDPRELILVGGGDVLLAAGESDPDAVMGHAGLATLAEETVASLVQAGVTGKISIKVDDSLFTGRPAEDVWLAGDLQAGQVAPIFPMALNSGRYSPAERYGARPQDSALHAGRTFAAALQKAGKEAGIKVAEGVSRKTSGEVGEETAAVQSATVGEQVELMLETSDNYLAETLSRMAAVAKGRPASFDGSTKTIEKTIAGLGVDTSGLALADSSGLSPANRISTAQLAATLRIIVNTEDPDLAAVRDGLPIAGLTGTLSDRYTKDPALAGAGLVRAKTGTLNEVLALSGYVVTDERRLLVFSFIGNDLGSVNLANEHALDRAAAILAGCGCGK
ncbi:D-alanyl-D-alanine carboxypeptidase/D-alanyl-D-alanine endopeptidase [Arthrobacter monumenti]